MHYAVDVAIADRFNNLPQEGLRCMPKAFREERN
jgi:hypothetical protein